MTPGPAAALSASEVYAILRKAATRRQPVAATYDGQPRLLCPHVGGRKSGRWHVLCYQFGGGSNSAESLAPEAEASGVVSRWRNSAMSSCGWAHGTQSHAPISRPALMISISIPTLSPEMTRTRGSEVTAAPTDAPERSVTSQSSADYVARGERGDPRGRKFGVGLGTTNLRRPARAEGEKRFRSATRNP